MKVFYLCSVLLLLTQCSVNKEVDEFIEQLTGNNWFIPDAINPGIPSSTPFIFNSDGSFTEDFVDIDGNTHQIVYSINRVLNSSFTFYKFELLVDGEMVILGRGVGIGFNKDLKSVVFQGSFREESTAPLPSATTTEKIEWYEKTYKMSNFVQHAGDTENTIAIQ